VQNLVAEPPSVDKGRPASKLSVSAPGRAIHPNAAPTLNIGMDPWSTSPSVVTPSGQGEVNAAASSQSNGSLSLMVWFFYTESDDANCHNFFETLTIVMNDQ
jgi:plant G-box-binding factor